MKLLKKVLSFTMVLLMVVSMLPVSVAADEVDGTPESQTHTEGCALGETHEGDCIVCDGTADCPAPTDANHKTGCLKMNPPAPQTHTEGCVLGETHEGNCIVCDGTADCPVSTDASHKTGCLKIATPDTQLLNTENGGEEDEGNDEGNNDAIPCDGTDECMATSNHDENCELVALFGVQLQTMSGWLTRETPTGNDLLTFNMTMSRLKLTKDTYGIILAEAQQTTYNQLTDLYNRLNDPDADPMNDGDTNGENDVAKIGTTGYETLAAALAAAQSGDTIVLLKSAQGDGIVINKSMTIDLGGFTYTVTGNLAGSSGSKSQGFQILKDNTVTIKNGTLNCTADSGAQIMIQNYSNLTLTNVHVNGSNLGGIKYTLSNNNGEVSIGSGTTITAASGGVAFDVCRFANYNGATVTVNGATIHGIIEVADSPNYTGSAKSILTLTAGTIDGTLRVTTALGSAGITKAAAVSLAAPEGYKWDENGKLIEKMVASVEETEYKTLAEAINAASGKTVTVLEDCTLDEDITITSGTVTLDLNEKTISGNKSILVRGGTVTIQNGTIESKHTFSGELTTNLLIDGNAKVTAKNVAFNGAKYGIRIEKTASGASFTLESGSITATEYGIVIWSRDGSNSLTVKGGTITAPSGISGNGTAPQTTAIQFEGGIINATETAIYHPQNGKLTVSGGKITGKTGIEMRGGELEISGGEITGNGDFSVTSDGSGATTNGAGIALSPYTANTVTAKITSGKVSGKASIAVNSKNGGETAKINLTIEGGTFTGSMALDSSAEGKVEATSTATITPPEGYTWNSENKLAKIMASVGDKDLTTKEELVAEIDKITASGDPVEAPLDASATATSNTVSADVISAIKASGNTNVQLTIPTTSDSQVTLNAAATNVVIEDAPDTGAALNSKVENVTGTATLPADTFVDDAVVFDVTMTLGTTPITDLEDGLAEVTVELPSDFPDVDEVIVSYVNETGVKVNSGYNPKVVGTKCIFYTDHLSVFVVEPALAEDSEHKYASLQAAINAVGTTPDTIVLLANVNENVTIAAGQNITLDLNGFTINGKTVANKPAIDNNGTLTINDSSTGKTGKVIREDVGSPAYYVIRNNGTMTINAGTITNNSGSTDTWAGSAVIANGTSQAATLNVNGGKISQQNFIAIKNDDYGTLNVKGGIIETRNTAAPGGGYVSAIQNWNIANISSGTITGPVYTGTYAGNTTTTISGNTKINGTLVMAKDANATEQPKLEIKGGEITGEIKTSGTGVEPVVTATTSAISAPNGYTWVSNGHGFELVADTVIENNDSNKYITFTIEAVWDDYSDKWDMRPSSQKVDLYFNEEKSDSPVILTSANNWKETVTVRSTYTPTGGTTSESTIVTIVPAAVTGYSTTKTGSHAKGFTITNTLTAETYEITKYDKKVIIGSAATFFSDIPAGKFDGVKVGTEAVAATNYTAEATTTGIKVTLKADYVRYLGLGDHTVTLLANDGEVSATFAVKHPTIYHYNPDKLLQTGQLNWPVPVMAILGTAALAMGLWFLMEMKKKHYES